MENFFGHLHNCCQMQAVVTLDSLKPFSQWEKVYKSNGLDLMVLMSCIAKKAVAVLGWAKFPKQATKTAGTKPSSYDCLSARYYKLSYVQNYYFN